MKYRKKPVIIEAIKYIGTNESKIEIWQFCKNINIFWDEDDKVVIPTLEGNMKASVGDYIIRGVNGELYPCKPDIFEKTYEALE